MFDLKEADYPETNMSRVSEMFSGFLIRKKVETG